MLDSYDMPMLDYPTDLDVQMHPSASDQWLQDEAKMEEDGSYPSKTDFEVDMEPSADDQNVEYDMLDDDNFRGSDAEVLDVEVYDVSVAHSPAMVNLDIPYEQSPSISSNFLLDPLEIQVLQPSTDDAVFREDSGTATHETSSEVIEEPIQPPAEPEGILPDQHEFPDSRDIIEVLLPSDGHEQGLPERYPASDQVILPTDEQELQQSEYRASKDDSISRFDDQAGVQSQDGLGEGVVVTSSNDVTTEAAQDLHVIEVEGSLLASESESGVFQDNQGQEQSSEQPGQQEQGPEEQEPSPEVRVEAEPASAHSSGDPHEISEGVYIDPPPPVLLSFASEDHLRFCLFNQAQDRVVDTKDPSTHQVLLHQHPTLYYEPLSTVFDALRQEEFVQSVFHLPDSELVLEAIDLQLIINEDNIYAVDVSLHDLNVLHDGSGIGGLLRMRLFSVTPRFITRYQYLQEQVNRLHLEQPSIEAQTTAIEASQGAPQEADRLSVPEENVKCDSSQPAETAESSVRAGVDDNDADPRQGLSKVPSSEGSLSTSTSGLEHLGESEEDNLHDGIESVQPIPQNEKQDHDTNSSPNNPTAADHSPVAEEHRSIDDYSEHHVEDDTIPLETLEASDQDDDEYSGAGHVDLSRDTPPQGIVGRGGDETDQGVEEASTDAAQEVKDQSDRVNAVAPSVSNTSSMTEDRTTADLDDDTYDLEGGVEHASNIDAQEDLEENIPFKHFSDNGEQENRGESVIEYEGKLTITAELEPHILEENNWEDDLDGEGEFDTTWDEGHDNTLSQSNHSSVTLSSTASKRSFDEFESAGDLYNEETENWSPPSSPDPKRSRIQ